MNLAALKQLEPLESQPYCHQQAEKHFDAALGLLEKAQKRGFDKPEPLLQAASLLLEALRYRRQDLRPHLALAYLFSLREDQDMALVCLSAAARLAPDHSFVAELLLDDCDHFADRLDGLESRGQQPPELLQFYQRLIGLVAGLQERQERYAAGQRAGSAA